MFWDKIAALILRNRIIWLVILLGLTVFMGFQASKIELAYDMQKLVPKTDKDFIGYINFKKKFGEDGNKLIVGIQSKNFWKIDFFRDYAKMCDSLAAIDGVLDVVSPARVVSLEIDDSLQEFVTHRLINSDVQTQEELDSLYEVFRTLKFYDGLVYNKEKEVALCIVSMKQSVLDSENRLVLMRQAMAITQNFGARNRTEMRYSGLPHIRTVFSTKVKHEITLFTLIAFAVTAVLILLLFRSITTTLISLVFIAVAVIWCVGFTHLYGYKINILIGTMPPLLVVIGVQNTIYLINKYHDEFRKHRNKIKALSRIISRIGIASFLINLTTAIGFGVFWFTETAVLQQFGAVAFSSIIAIFVITLVGLPIAYSYMPAPSMKQISHLENRNITRFLEWVRYMVFHRKRRIYFWSLAITVFAGIYVFRLKPLAFMVDDIPKNSPLYQDLEFFQEHFSGVMPFELIVECTEENGARSYATLNKVYALQRKLEKFPELSRPLSLVELVSFANQTLHDGERKYYRLPPATELGQIAAYMPEPQEGKKSIMEGLVDRNFRELRVSYQMADVGSIRMKEISQEVEEIIKDLFPRDQYDVHITGTSAIFLKGNSYLYESLGTSTFWALIMITFTMGLLFPSLKMILISLIPNCIPLIVTAGIMGYLEVPLKPSTILVFSISFGIAVDATIHFVTAFRRELKHSGKNLRQTLSHVIMEVGYSMIYSITALFTGFMIFVFSDFQGTVALGALTGTTLLVGMFANLFLLPALILSFEKGLNPKEELRESVLELPESEDDK
jgi:uncharacterized protein